jgi:hypothetical protein
VIVAEEHRQNNWYNFKSSFDYIGMGVHLNIQLRVFLHVFRDPLRLIPILTTCTIIPAAREPISVAISFDLPRKRRVMTEDVNVSKVRERWTGW